MNSAPTSAPADNSTDIDPADDETQDDGAEDSTEGLPADDNSTPDQPITLSPQMADAAGLSDLKPGDSFSVMIHGTVTDNTDGTLTADIEDAMGGKKSAGDAAATPPARKPQSRVVGPVEAGLMNGDGTANL